MRHAKVKRFLSCLTLARFRGRATLVRDGPAGAVSWYVALG